MYKFSDLVKKANQQKDLNSLSIKLQTIFFGIMAMLVPAIGLSFLYGTFSWLHLLYGFLTLIPIGLGVMILSGIVGLCIGLIKKHKSKKTSK